MGQKKITEDFSLEETKQLMDLSDCAMFSALQGPDITLLYGNKKMYSMIQYSPEEFSEKFQNRLMDIILPEDKQKVRMLIARQSTMGGTIHLEFRIQRKDNVAQWVSLSARSVLVGDSMRYYCSCVNVTQQKRTLQEVYNAKREVDAMANSIPGGVIKLKMSDFTLLYANDGFYRLAGYSRTEYFSLFGNQCDKVIHPEDARMVNAMVQSAVENHGSLGFEYRIIDKNGEVRWSYVNGRRVDDYEGSPVYLCIIMDITSRKNLEHKLEDNVRRSRCLHRYLREVEWTYHVDTDKFCRSGELESTFSEEEELLGFMSGNIIDSIIHPEDAEKFREALEKRIRTIGESQEIIRVKNHQGDYHTTLISMVSISLTEDDKPDRIYGESRMMQEEMPFASGAGARRKLGMKSDYSSLLELVEKNHREPKDMVTELMGFEEFLRGVQEILDKSGEKDRFGILCCDINTFQKLNFHYGISAGNEILRLFGNTLKETLVYDGLASRIKGDYFVVLFKYEEYGELLKTLSQMMREMTVKEEKLTYKTYGCTCGIYLIRTEDKDINQIMEYADLARRSIKGTRGNHFAIYTDDVEKNRFYEEELIQEISEAMQNGTVEICYQPRIRDNKENVMGCKVVPGVQRKNGEYIPLEDIRRYVDRTPDIQQLPFYVLSRVCRTQGAWKAKGKKIMPISLDITQGQLCIQGAVDKIDQIVKENKLDPYEILFEIQEQYFRDMIPSFQLALEELQKRGYRVIISRFGSDHTALQAIRYLPIHAIKFHGEFFHENMTNEKERLMFKRIVELARELGMEVSCGGIHTKMQEDVARTIGCDILEGDMYYGTIRNDVYEKCFLSE